MATRDLAGTSTASSSAAAISAVDGRLETTAAILLVDDEPSKRLSIQAVLAPLGHVVVEAESGEAALHAVIARSFAVILIDVQMPGMDGYETASLIRMRKQSEHTPIIFITVHPSDEADVPLAYANGAVDFMFGTIVPGILRAEVAFFVELFRKSRELEKSLGELEKSLSEVTILSDQFREGEAQTRAVLQSVADGILTINDGGVIESFNRAATDLVGYTEAIGRRFSTIVAESLGWRQDRPSQPPFVR